MARRRSKNKWTEGGKPVKCRICHERSEEMALVSNAHAVCPSCASVFLSEWSPHMRSSDYASRIKSTYGLTAEQHAAMFLRQRGVCAICQDGGRSARGDSHISGLVVDHDHETGEVRGLLCAKCNSAIGMLDDDPDTVKRAYGYLTGRRMKVPPKDHTWSDPSFYPQRKYITEDA